MVAHVCFKCFCLSLIVFLKSINCVIVILSFRFSYSQLEKPKRFVTNYENERKEIMKSLISFKLEEILRSLEFQEEN